MVHGTVPVLQIDLRSWDLQLSNTVPVEIYSTVNFVGIMATNIMEDIYLRYPDGARGSTPFV